MMCLDLLRMVVVNYITAHLFGELFVALESSRGALELPGDGGRQCLMRRLWTFCAGNTAMLS